MVCGPPEAQDNLHFLDRLSWRVSMKSGKTALSCMLSAIIANKAVFQHASKHANEKGTPQSSLILR